jgi:hypothetical protein
MTLEGAGQHQIAEALGCSQPAVSGHQRALAQEWRESAAQEIGEHRARILAELAEVRAQAWRAWFVSMEAGKGDAALLRAITVACVEVLKATGGSEAPPPPGPKPLWIVPPQMSIEEWTREAQKMVRHHDGNTS